MAGEHDVEPARAAIPYHTAPIPGPRGHLRTGLVAHQAHEVAGFEHRLRGAVAEIGDAHQGRVPLAGTQHRRDR